MKRTEKKYKFVYFDVANTLLHKPALFSSIKNALFGHHLSLPVDYIKERHRLLSEICLFPNKTSAEFYRQFNEDLLRLLGVVPTKSLIDDIFEACRHLSWEAFEDTIHICDLPVEVGVLSNWDDSLPAVLTEYFPNVNFRHVVVSEYLGVRKPDVRIFEYAIRETGYAPEEIMFVGDSIKLDYAPAVRSGLQPVLIDRDAAYPYFDGARIGRMNELIQLLV